MIAFLEKLTKRKTEVAQKTGGEWQALVIAVADGKQIDPDETLAALDRLGKSLDDLANSVALLNQRREWAKIIAAGETAEADHPNLTRKIESEIAAFNLLEEKHEATLFPMTRARAAAAQSMVDATQAKRELQRTATDPIQLQAVQDADAAMTELQIERAEFDRDLRAKEDRLVEMSHQNDDDLAGHVERLKSDIETMRAQAHSFDERSKTINAECEAARAALLNSAAI